jgi:hypothetical protein
MLWMLTTWQLISHPDAARLLSPDLESIGRGPKRLARMSAALTGVKYFFRSATTIFPVADRTGGYSSSGSGGLTLRNSRFTTQSLKLLLLQCPQQFGL